MNTRKRKPSSLASNSQSGLEKGSSTRRASIGLNRDGNALGSPSCSILRGVAMAEAL